MDPIEVCLSFLRKYKDPPPDELTKPIGLGEYLMSFGSLDALDFFLFMFLVLFIIGVIFAFTENKDKTALFLSISFIGVIAFTTLKMTNERLAADICMTCVGQNKMQFGNRIEVVLSFVWVTIQTFVGLFMNALYYLVILYAIYITLRSHVCYSFGEKLQPETKDMRLMSFIHKWDPKESFIPIMIGGPLKIGYYVLMLLIVLAVLAMVVLSIVQPSVFKSFLDKVSSSTKGGAGALMFLIMPFVLSAIALLMNFFSNQPMLDRVDKIIVQKVIPILHHTTVMRGFNFFEKQIFKAHIVALGNAVINAVLYAFVFLKPLAKTDICVDGQVQNDNPEFEMFKHRFLIGHYIIGSLMILTFTVVLGDEIGIGQALVKYGLLFLVVMYGVTYLLVNTRDIQESSDEDK